MRSELVHSANKCVDNRFLLCRVAATAARKMHQDRWHFSESINRALTQIANLSGEKRDFLVEPVALETPEELGEPVLP